MSVDPPVVGSIDTLSTEEGPVETQTTRGWPNCFRACKVVAEMHEKTLARPSPWVTTWPNLDAVARAVLECPGRPVPSSFLGYQRLPLGEIWQPQPNSMTFHGIPRAYPPSKRGRSSPSTAGAIIAGYHTPYSASPWQSGRSRRRLQAHEVDQRSLWAEIRAAEEGQLPCTTSWRAVLRTWPKATVSACGGSTWARHRDSPCTRQTTGAELRPGNKGPHAQEPARVFAVYAHVTPFRGRPKCSTTAVAWSPPTGAYRPISSHTIAAGHGLRSRGLHLA